ncbi:unnamed protein product [Gadus morhua 'NCC']
MKEKEAQRTGAGASAKQPWKYMAVLGFLAPFLHDRGTTSNLQHRDPPPVLGMAVMEELEDWSDYSVAAVVGGASGVPAVTPPAEEAGALSPPAAAAMAGVAAPDVPAATAAPAAADRGPVGRINQWRVQPPEEGRGRKRRRPEMSSFEQGMLAVMEPLATLALQPQP